MEVKEQWRRSKFVWGETDCIMATCNYIRDVTGVDPAKPWRGSYDSEESAEAIYAPFGGVLGLFCEGMERAGFIEGDCKAGRPVVCEIGGNQVAGIDFGDRVGFMAPRGMVEIKATVLKAWIV